MEILPDPVPLLKVFCLAALLLYPEVTQAQVFIARFTREWDIPVAQDQNCLLIGRGYHQTQTIQPKTWLYRKQPFGW